ncbi:uncharacterized protein C16orf95 homolog isoform X2 [Physeter macrocephalus]|uniref:Uncharacterized protein C16orf95 homolog isoform X2 n=1 Tax=Physeter macrocephalus TaxID=9755 RepID=A0A455APS5_PHYMC|nr:uncharacterized protein C16orf95 homolog isoform X2 [Physeter catodon]|eukprot:XP_028333871.1 uncharacterized protein C16orf95 homolog isoform X2 [Physeter catodon]
MTTKNASRCGQSLLGTVTWWRTTGERSTFQTFGEEVCPIDRSMCPVPSSVHREPTCCECQAKFEGRLPVPRAEALLPYWVPLSLRPQKQIQKMVRFYGPKTTKACLCPCHHFGGRLPMPRDQAVMPYWVPQVLRSHKKVVKRQQSFKGIPEVPLDVRSGYNRWRICDGEGCRLLKWQQLQALHQAEPVSPGQPASLQASLLPLSLSLLTLLQALLSVIVAIWCIGVSQSASMMRPYHTAVKGPPFPIPAPGIPPLLNLCQPERVDPSLYISTRKG